MLETEPRIGQCWGSEITSGSRHARRAEGEADHLRGEANRERDHTSLLEVVLYTYVNAEKRMKAHLIFETLRYRKCHTSRRPGALVLDRSWNSQTEHLMRVSRSLCSSNGSSNYRDLRNY